MYTDWISIFGTHDKDVIDVFNIDVSVHRISSDRDFCRAKSISKNEGSKWIRHLLNWRMEDLEDLDVNS